MFIVFVTRYPYMEDIGTISVSIRTLSGKVFSIVCSRQDNVHAIKSAVEEHEGMPIDTQILLFNGIRLRDFQSLTHYNIVDESIISLIYNLRGD